MFDKGTFISQLGFIPFLSNYNFIILGAKRQRFNKTVGLDTVDQHIKISTCKSNCFVMELFVSNFNKES